MTPIPWAGHPLLRPFQRWLGRRSTPLNPPDIEEGHALKLRRLILLSLVIFGAWRGTEVMAEVLPEHGGTWLEQLLLVLFGILFGWISAGFWTAMMGAWVMLTHRDGYNFTAQLKKPEVGLAPIPADAQTAIVMPICNEDVAAVFGNLRATIESLRATGFHERFDVFVLSDTNDPNIRMAEQCAFGALRDALGMHPGNGGGQIYYRWRQYRTKRKAGNVADFCRRWGSEYKYMVVLDADSVMTGTCLTSLVRLMQVHTDVGIIQTAPCATGHSTLHARIQQFGSRLYGPLFTAGMRFWQLGESHYWGHNAILRIAPFMKHCALAPLPGNGALSGEVMSHDFIEAALMRRAGWKVWVADDLEGSYEQVPPNLDSELQRERRWCQGNLQNARLMFEPRLHVVHRSMLVTGLLSYLSAPLWLGFLIASTLLFTNHVDEVPSYFVSPYQLFPIWPTHDPALMLTLFGLTAVLLIGPKIMAIIVTIGQGQAASFGGVFKLLLSALIEFLWGMLLAPVRMLFHSRFVLGALLGIKSGWVSPPRDNEVTTLWQAWQRHGVHTLLTCGWIAAIVGVGSAFPWWMSPVIAGLLLAVPLVSFGSRTSVGVVLRRWNMLLTPEERHIPAELVAASRYAATQSTPSSVREALITPAYRDALMHAGALHESLPCGLKAQTRHAWLETAEAQGFDSLPRAQQLRLVGDLQAVRSLVQALQLESSVTHTPAAHDADTTDAANKPAAHHRPPRSKLALNPSGVR